MSSYDKKFMYIDMCENISHFYLMQIFELYYIYYNYNDLNSYKLPDADIVAFEIHKKKKKKPLISHLFSDRRAHGDHMDNMRIISSNS